MEELDPEELVVCPYESAHLVRVKRMQMHIYDCRKNHPNSGIGKCPFNASHVVYNAERRWHLMTCPDRHQVHSKIVQEMNTTENRGCVETPVYRPVTTFGESWEAREERDQPRQAWSAPAVNASATVEASQTEQATKGLNPRLKRQMYLKKVAEEEEKKKNAQNSAPPSAFPTGVQKSSDSQSLARFQQQTKMAKGFEPDIYQAALKKPTEGQNIAIGRGQGAFSVYGRGESCLSPGSLARGRGSGTPSIVDTMPQPASAAVRGRTAPHPMGRMGNAGDGSMTMMAVGRARTNGEAGPLSIGGRGSVMGIRTESPPAALGRGGDMRLGAYGSQGVSPGGAVPMRFGALGLGRGNVSTVPPPPSRGIPFGGITSQPDALAPVLHHMVLADAGGVGRGYITTSLTPGYLEDDQDTDSRESEDPGKYMDAELLIRGGYSQAGGPEQASPQHQPWTSSSSMSLGSNPAAVKSWAAEMERVDDGSSSAAFESAESDEAGLSDATVKNKLKKIEKKLREIAKLEARKNSGEKLDGAQEEKLKKKADYEKDAALLRQLFTMDQID